MKSIRHSLLLLTIVAIGINCSTRPVNKISISKAVLKDKIAGAWAGKMIGVTYGAPTEFRAQGKTFEDSIKWTPDDTKGSMWQDDIYVQLTFMMSMDQYGMNCDAKKYQEMFAKAGYMLWHANVQARKNYYDSIFPPLSGDPKFNSHADDIDFQIESDYLGLICPGMPVTASKWADKIGHIMNYGDGVYGGIFVASLYTHAFFENDIPTIINKALLSLPEQSDYRKIISDVIQLHQHYPKDWRAAWKDLYDKWGYDHFCEAGGDFNIDAKLNGAFIVMGLLYGEGDIERTLEITTRCGQDSDCNPSNAMAVLGVIFGFDKLPAEMKHAVTVMSDSLFINTNYSFNKAVERTYDYASKIIVENGGSISDSIININIEEPVAAPLEVSFSSFVLDKKLPAFDSSAWTCKGNWQVLQKKDGENKMIDQSKWSGNTGDEIELNFSGTGVSIYGNWVKDGGKADVYLDDKLHRAIDTYYFYNNQEHENICIWHVTGLPDTQHKVRFVIRADKKPESLGSNIYITRAVTYKTGKKKSEGYKFSFEK